MQDYRDMKECKGRCGVSIVSRGSNPDPRALYRIEVSDDQRGATLEEHAFDFLMPANKNRVTQGQRSSRSRNHGFLGLSCVSFIIPRRRSV